MWLADSWKDYEVLDTSAGEKLERWGKYILVRPDPQVIWNTPKDDPLWRKYDARYARSNTGGGKWQNLRLPAQWQVRYKELTFQVKPMNFKHTGLFPEQAANWDFAQEQIANAGREINVLNLFAYTGGATVACAAAGAKVCHVDAVNVPCYIHDADDLPKKEEPEPDEDEQSDPDDEDTTEPDLWNADTGLNP